MYSTRNTMMQSTNVLVDSCDMKGSSFQTAVKLLSLYAPYGEKQHVPLSLLKSHAQKAMEVILKSYVDRASVQSSCDELNGEATVCLPAFMHIKPKEGDPSDNQFNELDFLASRFVLECLGHLPCEVVVLLLTFLLSGLRALTKEAPLVMLHACDKINERLMLHASTVRSLAVARDRVRDPVECTDKNNNLVMHRDKDIDMFHLDWDFNVPVWAYGQPGTAEPETYSCYCHVRWCVLYLEVSEEPSSSRRSPACRGGARPYIVRWGYGLGRVWPWAGVRSGSFVGSTRRNAYVRISGGDSEVLCNIQFEILMLIVEKSICGECGEPKHERGRASSRVPMWDRNVAIVDLCGFKVDIGYAS
ncbi:hypothetical protein Scep_020055 [Stephania cephalantha]|uniref:Uncharacterized protein n=1 Tax=Stephania cephalantha TaxID=152367 RepID=A0AAP0IBX2_9MAGN